MEAAGAGGHAGFLVRRVHVAQHRRQHEKDRRNHGEAHDEGHAVKREDVEGALTLHSQQRPQDQVDDPDARVQQPLPSQCRDHGRKRHGHENQGVHEMPPGSVGPFHQPGQRHGEGEPGQDGARSEHQRVEDQLVGARVDVDFEVVVEGEAADLDQRLSLEREEHDQEQRDDHEPRHRAQGKPAEDIPFAHPHVQTTQAEG